MPWASLTGECEDEGAEAQAAASRTSEPSSFILLLVTSSPSPLSSFFPLGGVVERRVEDTGTFPRLLSQNVGT